MVTAVKRISDSPGPVIKKGRCSWTTLADVSFIVIIVVAQLSSIYRQLYIGNWDSVSQIGPVLLVNPLKSTLLEIRVERVVSHTKQPLRWKF